MTAPPTPDEVARWHRWFAVECNNRAWQLADQEARTAAEMAEMLHAAHAATLHWSRIGNASIEARAKLLLAHVHALAGNGNVAMPHARESFAFLTSHDSPDWEVAYAHAVMANAAHAVGDSELHRHHHREPERLAATIADPEDRRVFLASFARVPAP